MKRENLPGDRNAQFSGPLVSSGGDSPKVMSQMVAIQFSIWSRYASGPVSIPQSLQATLALAHRPCSSARPPQKMHVSSGMDASRDGLDRIDRIGQPSLESDYWLSR
jgi:hypothetical protein